MKLTIELNEEQKVTFLAENSGEHTTGDVINLLMFVADTIIAEAKEKTQQNGTEKNIQLA